MAKPKRKRRQRPSNPQTRRKAQEANPYATPVMASGSEQATGEMRPEIGEPTPSTVRFARLNDACKVVSQQLLKWALVVLLFGLSTFVANVGLGLGGEALGVAIRSLLNMINSPPIAYSLAGYFMGVVSFLVGTAVYAFLIGGLFRIACRQVRGQPIDVGDLFKTGDVFWQLFLTTLVLNVLGALVGVVVWIGFVGLVPRLPAESAQIAIGLAFIIGLVIFGAFASRLMLALPLVVDGGQKATVAIRNSWVALRGQTVKAMIFNALAFILSILGALLCGVGLLITFPIYYVAVALVYRDFFLRSSENSVGTEIR